MDNNAQNKRITPWLIIIFSVITYGLFLWMPELRASDESIIAAIAQDMRAEGHFLAPHFQGAPVRCFPLYPWLVAVLSWLFPASDWLAPLNAVAIRLPALLSLFGIAVVTALAAQHYRNSANAGIIAAGIVLCCAASMRVGLIAQCETLHAFLLTAAWFVWYELGPQRQKWHAAWGCALGIILLDMTNVGLAAPLQFYIPLILASKPPKLKKQLQKGRHLFWLFLYTLIFALWVTRFCQQPLLSWDTIIAPAGSNSHVGFFTHLVVFPVKCVLYLLPWGIFFWMPFCLALHPLEPRGSSCSFFRAVVFCLFFFAWIMPNTSPLALLTVLGPMAFLISVNIELVIHRNEYIYQRIANWLSTVATVGCALAFLFCIALANGYIRFGETPQHPSLKIAAAIQAIILLGIAIYMLISNRKGHCQIIMTFTTAFMSIVLAWRCIQFNAEYYATTDRLNTVKQLTANLPTDVKPNKLYLATSRAYPVQCHYLGVPVRKITNPADELPDTEDVVYLLSNKHPLTKKRAWTALSEEVNLNQLRGWDWHWDGEDTTPFWQRKLILQRTPLNDAAAQELPRFLPSENCRLYRGELISNQ